MIQARQQVKSAPAFSRLPRLDSDLDRRELADPKRRQATARLRREFLASRLSEADDQPRDHRDACHSQNYKRYLERLRQLREKTAGRRHHRNATKCPPRQNSAFSSEVIKRDVPERLGFCVSINIPDCRPVRHLTDATNTSMPLFHTVRTTNKPTPHNKTTTENRHFFIEREWPSERISLVRFKKHTPELYRRSWIG